MPNMKVKTHSLTQYTLSVQHPLGQLLVIVVMVSRTKLDLVMLTVLSVFFCLIFCSTVYTGWIFFFATRIFFFQEKSFFPKPKKCY